MWPWFLKRLGGHVDNGHPHVGSWDQRKMLCTDELKVEMLYAATLQVGYTWLLNNTL